LEAASKQLVPLWRGRAPGDTIQVAPGTYSEDVIIGKSLSLIGASSANTIIDAKGQANGVYIDGLDNPSLSEVVVTGFTVQNANFEGILQPAFETNEDFDCGEGIHLSGVDHSTVANNFLQNNSGGVLLSDDTGATHDNLITGNVALNNPFDCGITLASHALYSQLPSNTPRGVDRNTVSDNDSSKNGLAVEGAGAGVGLFVAGNGLEAARNVVIGNRLTSNGLPGVAFHLHHQLPTKAVLIVTHNIEEAVLMCDRILVLGSNPGHIAAEIPVALDRRRACREGRK
jgi:nitrous oxidase accessory protein NosD